MTPRYLSRLTKEQQASEQKWRTVGTIRRYILLLLTLAQTVVATVHENHSAVPGLGVD